MDEMVFLAFRPCDTTLSHKGVRYGYMEYHCYYDAVYIIHTRGSVIDSSPAYHCRVVTEVRYGYMGLLGCYGTTWWSCSSIADSICSEVRYG